LFRLGQYGPGAARWAALGKDFATETFKRLPGRGFSWGRACPSLHHWQRVIVREKAWVEEAPWSGGDCAAAPPINEGAECHPPETPKSEKNGVVRTSSRPHMVLLLLPKQKQDKIFL